MEIVVNKRINVCICTQTHTEKQETNPKEEVDIVKTIINEAPIIVSHVETKAIVGDIIEKLM